MLSRKILISLDPFGARGYVLKKWILFGAPYSGAGSTVRGLGRNDTHLFDKIC